MTNLAGAGFNAGPGAGAMSSIVLQPGIFKFYGNDSTSHKQKATLYNPFDFKIKYKIMSTAPLKYLVAEPKGSIQPRSYVELLVRINKNVSFQDDPQQSSKLAKDKLRVIAYRLKDNSIYDDNDDDDLPNDSNNNSGNLTLVSKKDYLLVYFNRRSDAADFIHDQLNDEDALLGANDNLASYSSLSHGNNLNAIMNMNRSSMNSMKNRGSPLTSAMKKPTILNNRKVIIPASAVAEGENVNYLVLLIGLICLGVLFLPLNSTTESSLPKYLHVTVEIKLFASFVMGMVTMVILRS